MLYRAVLPQRAVTVAISNPSTTLAAAARRPFSTSIRTLKDDSNSSKPSSRRYNPLVGNYQPAKPAQTTPAEREPPVNTAHPRASRTPSPSRAPFSSADVPPNADMPPPPPPPTSAPESSTDDAAGSRAKKHRYDANSNYVDIAKILENSAAEYAKSIDMTADPQRQPRVHTRPASGRTVFLEGAGPGSAASKAGQAAYNPQQAFIVLDRLVKDQKIRQLFNRQKFHERKGMMRKRLKMQRWRFRFKKGFKAAASRVLELKKQGW